MKIIELTSNITLYVFDPVNKDDDFGNKITVIKDRGNALLIDTGYMDQYLTVKDRLENEGYEITDLVLTHFHDDHAEGLECASSDITTYGSAYYKTALNRYLPKDKHPLYALTHAIARPTSFTFGPNTLTLIPHRGHSIDGLLVVINGKYMHIGDEVMFSNEGEPLLPAITFNDIPYQLESYQKLSTFKHDYHFIYGHGLNVKKETFLQALKDLTLYLNRMYKSKGNLSYQEATHDLETTFKQTSWHDMIKPSP